MINANGSPPTAERSSSVIPQSSPRGAVRPLMIGNVVVDPPVLQAPMAGFTNFAYRQIVREFGGAGLQATEMVSAADFWPRTSATASSPIDCGA